MSSRSHHSPTLLIACVVALVVAAADTQADDDARVALEGGNPESIVTTAATSELDSTFDPPAPVMRPSGTPFEYGGGFRDRPGFDFYEPGGFENAFRIPNSDVYIKPGGFIQLHIIHDFNAIDTEDSFVTSEIPTSGPDRTNTRLHARPSRLNLDIRGNAGEYGEFRIFTEGDFFSDGDRFRLRHAFGEMGPILAGHTWTTFTDVAALPTTLDFETPVAFVARRQGQLRFTTPLAVDDLTWSVAIEEPVNIIEVPDVPGESRTPSPDFVTRLRWEPGSEIDLQLALVLRKLGFQPEGAGVFTGTGYGLNFSGHIRLSDDDNFLFQIVGGEGIGSYWGIPDVAPSGPMRGTVLPIVAFMVGLGHNWTADLASNITYSRSRIDNTAFQRDDDLHATEYFAANLIWTVTEQLSVGGEYLYGTRVDVDGSAGAANRLEFVATWLLP